jgi:hypothetical protein
VVIIARRRVPPPVNASGASAAGTALPSLPLQVLAEDFSLLSTRASRFRLRCFRGQLVVMH